jgi:hypothetical protein
MASKQRPNKPYDIFLSYANDDLSRVGPLVQALESMGWRVWWDRRIPAGRTFRQVIAAALDDSCCVVVVWTATSVERNWVLEEAEVGAERGSLIPVFLDDIQAPFGFRLIQGARLDTHKRQD